MKLPINSTYHLADIYSMAKLCAVLFVMVIVLASILLYTANNTPLQEYSDLSSSIGLLQIYVVLFSLGLGILAFVGYESMKREVKKSINRHIERIIHKLITDAIEKKTSEITNSIYNILRLIVKKITKDNAIFSKIDNALSSEIEKDE